MSQPSDHFFVIMHDTQSFLHLNPYQYSYHIDPIGPRCPIYCCPPESLSPPPPEGFGGPSQNEVVR